MSGPNGDPNISVDDSMINDEDEFDEEFVAVNSMLDEINSYLDVLEEKNDALNGKLDDLMASTRQARLDFRAQLLGPETQEENCPADGDSSPSPGQEDHKGNEGSEPSV